MGKYTLGLLEFGYRGSRTKAPSILNNIFESAILADKLGYSCFWLGEHHNGSNAWSNPEMLLPVIAGMTNRISVGAAGILLSVHSPYRVALNFKLLANLFPNRIDLGMANGNPGVKFARMLLNDPQLDDTFMKFYPGKLKEIMQYLSDDMALYEQEQIVIPPSNSFLPTLWRLSSSFHSFKDCLEYKLNYSRSLFHSSTAPELSRSEIQQFRQSFFDKYSVWPKVNLVVAGICERQMKDAQRTFELVHAKKDREKLSKCVIGTPASIAEKLDELSERYGIDDFVFYDMGFELKKRTDAIKMLAKAAI